MSRLNRLVHIDRVHSWLPPAFVDLFLQYKPEYIKRSYISISNHFTANSHHVYLLGHSYE